MRMLGIIVIAYATLGLLSCGQKGPLQLPQEADYSAVMTELRPGGVLRYWPAD